MLAVFYAAILFLLFRQQRLGHSSTHLIIGAFPAALLFLVLPPVLPVLQLIQAFVRVAETKVGTPAAVMPFSFEITTALRLAAFEFLAAVVVAAALQWFIDRRGRSRVIAQESDPRRAARRRAIVLVSALVAIPAGVVNLMTGGIPELVAVASSTPVGDETVAAVSQRVATHLLLSAFGGILIAGVLVVLACASIRAVRSVSRNDLATRCVWAAVYVSSAWAMWGVMRLNADLGSYPFAVP